MKTLEQYEKYTIKTTKILQDFFELPNIPIKINHEKYNCFRIVKASGDILFVFDISNLKNAYDSGLCDDRTGKHKNFTLFLLWVFLHEIGHYQQYIKLGRSGFEKEVKKEVWINHDKRPQEIEADVFATDNYNGAKYFLRECLK